MSNLSRIKRNRSDPKNVHWGDSTTYTIERDNRDREIIYNKTIAKIILYKTLFTGYFNGDAYSVQHFNAIIDDKYTNYITFHYHNGDGTNHKNNQ